MNNISSLVNQETLTVIGIIFAFSWVGGQLGTCLCCQCLAGGIIGVATLFAGLPNQLAGLTTALANIGGIDKTTGTSKTVDAD